MFVDEAQRLRDMLRDRDLEIRDFEAAGQAHEADEQKVSCIVRERRPS